MVNVGDLLPDGFSSTVKVFWSNPLEPFEGFQCGSSARGFSMEVRDVDGFEVNRIT